MVTPLPGSLTSTRMSQIGAYNNETAIIFLVKQGVTAYNMSLPCICPDPAQIGLIGKMTVLNDECLTRVDSQYLRSI